jgi:hypothetical protein
MAKLEQTFWVTNITNLNVSLMDLGLTINARSSVNLLDRKHYYFTIEQLEQSAKSGSLFKKSNKIVIRKVAPKYEKSKIELLDHEIRPGFDRPANDIKEEKYEELTISDEKFAEESAEELIKD